MITNQKSVVPNVHGYLLCGDWDDVKSRLENEINDNLNVVLAANPDVVQIITESLSIDDARFVGEFQSKKSLKVGSKKIIIIATNSITREAQNALLKVLEDPTEYTYFFVVVRNAVTLLPTLKSRLLPISWLEKHAVKSFSLEFLAAEPSERLLLIEDILKSKDKMASGLLLDDILSVLYQKTENNNASFYRALDEIVMAKRSLSNRGASIKLLLEHIALTMPTTQVSH